MRPAWSLIDTTRWVGAVVDSTGAFSGLSRAEVPAGSAVVAGFVLAAQPLAGFQAAFFSSIGLILLALVPCLMIPPKEL